MAFFLKDIENQRFFGEYWRRRPLYLPQAAVELLDKAVTAEELRCLAVDLERRNPNLVRRDGDRALFAQGIDNVSSRLRAVVGRASAHLEWQDIWMDGSVLRDDASIGCHYDDSDNFILQQQGTKLWRLHPPSIVPDAELRRRMLHDPLVGNINMPNEAAEYLLEPGDILYVPIFWPHWGVSRGNSTSLSIVCNSANALDTLLPIIVRHLIEDPAWWRPLPLPLGGGNRKLQDQSDQCSRTVMLNELLEPLSSDELRNRVHVDFAQDSPTIREQEMAIEISRKVIAKATLGKRPQPSARPELSLDMDKLRPMFARRSDDFDLSDLIIPNQHGAADEKLRYLLSLLYLKRFLQTCYSVHNALEDEPLLRSLCSVLQSFQRLPPQAILAVVTRPEMTSWITYANEAVRHNYPPHLENMVRYLGAFLLPPLAAEERLEIGQSIWVARSRLRELDFGYAGYDLEVSGELPERVLVMRTLAGLLLSDGNGSFSAEIQLRMQQGEAYGPGGARWVSQTHLPHGGPALLRRHSWYEQYYPRDQASRASPIRFDMTDDQFTYFAECMSAGADLIYRLWPEAWGQFVQRIHVIAPLESAGLHPHNASVHGFRGLITSSPRPSYLAAQTLLHETGHNKFSSIYELFEIFENEEGTQAYSPFVGMCRPLPSLAHGIFAFLQDIHISTRMLGRVNQKESPSLEKYIAKTRAATVEGLEILKSTAILTERGRQLIDGFEAALAIDC